MIVATPFIPAKETIISILQNSPAPTKPHSALFVVLYNNGKDCAITGLKYPTLAPYVLPLPTCKQKSVRP